MPHVPGPWKYSDRNWRNEQTDSAWYVTGDHKEGHFDDEEDDDGEKVQTPTCVSVCIVPRNSTSHPTCEDTARLIAAAPDLLLCVEAAFRVCAIPSIGARAAALDLLTGLMADALAKAKGETT